MNFLRRWFGPKQRSVFSDEAVGDEQYDPETQEMILSSFDLLEHMSAKGESFEKERVVSHFFAGEPRNVSRAALMFQDLAFVTDIPDHDRLHVVGRALLSHQWVEQTMPLMCRLAGEFELNYDGWDCGPEIGPDQQLTILN
ncbi:ribonuclease E inhibitor RraB [Novosphingobium subterraneum]|uniref:Regulator of ribonuclease activity B domain-containing protein n=1 Tax=Novosphingobium subterraneum TaxID=48936 RepID=A0A0B9AEM7_9SPHN|nr:ribonuclease E inhibitor RraB [Novosphingobium subterraneum]KHS49112.1 hypothetical protein NJ75_00547 [Novosphingobium subterraneum]